MKKLIKNMLGITELEQKVAEAEVRRLEAEQALAARTAEEEEARRKVEELTAVINSKSAKEIATENREPYVSVVQVDIDPNKPGQGAFELDWNEFFVAQLMQAGYEGKNDEQIVDQWFQDVCRNIVLETFEQYQADVGNRHNRRDLGDGRVEVS